MNNQKTIPASSIRKSNVCIIVFCIGMLLLSLMIFHSFIKRRADDSGIENMSQMVKNLELTDLCLFTEARYTRNLSQTDLNSAFQDHPSSLEHFPAGSIAGPPAGLRRINDKPD